MSNNDNNYLLKAKKYKLKYLKLKNQMGGCRLGKIKIYLNDSIVYKYLQNYDIPENIFNNDEVIGQYLKSEYSITINNDTYKIKNSVFNIKEDILIKNPVLTDYIVKLDITDNAFKAFVIYNIIINYNDVNDIKIKFSDIDGIDILICNETFMQKYINYFKDLQIYSIYQIISTAIINASRDKISVGLGMPKLDNQIRTGHNCFIKQLGEEYEKEIEEIYSLANKIIENSPIIIDGRPEKYRFGRELSKNDPVIINYLKKYNILASPQNIEYTIIIDGKSYISYDNDSNLNIPTDIFIQNYNLEKYIINYKIINEDYLKAFAIFRIIDKYNYRDDKIIIDNKDGIDALISNTEFMNIFIDFLKEHYVINKYDLIKRDIVKNNKFANDDIIIRNNNTFFSCMDNSNDERFDKIVVQTALDILANSVYTILPDPECTQLLQPKSQPKQLKKPHKVHK